MKRIIRRNINLRLVNIDDAEYLLKIRNEDSISTKIPKLNISINAQKNWIQEYKNRELENTDFYYIIENKKYQNIGCVRIYDINNISCEWGNWIIERDSIFSASIESVLFVYDYVFNILKLEKSTFNVFKTNKSVINFHKRMGGIIISEDLYKVYFEYTKTKHLNIRDKFKNFL